MKTMEYKGFVGSISYDENGYYGYIQGTRVDYEAETEKDLAKAFRKRVDWLQQKDDSWKYVFDNAPVFFDA